jgi:Transposase, Mutator family
VASATEQPSLLPAAVQLLDQEGIDEALLIERWRVPADLRTGHSTHAGQRSTQANPVTGKRRRWRTSGTVRQSGRSGRAGEGGRTINVHALVATGVNADGHRENLGIDVTTSEDGAGCATG